MDGNTCARMLMSDTDVFTTYLIGCCNLLQESWILAVHFGRVRFCADLVLLDYVITGVLVWVR